MSESSRARDLVDRWEEQLGAPHLCTKRITLTDVVKEFMVRDLTTMMDDVLRLERAQHPATSDFRARARDR